MGSVKRLHDVQIKADETGRLGCVRIDGADIKGVRCVSFTSEAGETPTVTVTFYARVVDVGGAE